MSYSTLCNAARVTGLLPRHHISSDTASCWRATAMAVALVFLCRALTWHCQAGSALTWCTLICLCPCNTLTCLSY